MSTYLENYLESIYTIIFFFLANFLTHFLGISTLPSDLNRNFTLIGELDEKVQG